MVVAYGTSIFVLSMNDCAHGHFTRFNEAHLMDDDEMNLTYWATVGKLAELIHGESPFKKITSNRGKLQPWAIPVFGNEYGYRNLEQWEALTTDSIAVDHIVKFASDSLRSYQMAYEPQKLKPRNPPR